MIYRTLIALTVFTASTMLTGMAGIAYNLLQP